MKRGTSKFLWNSILCFLLLTGSFLAVEQIWGNAAPSYGRVLLPVFVAMGCLLVIYGALAERKVASFLHGLLWLLLLGYTGFHGYFSGFQALVYQWLQGVSQEQGKGIQWVMTEVSYRNREAVTILLLFLLAEGIRLIVFQRNLALCGIYGLFWIIMTLSSGSFTSLIAALFLAGFLGVWMLKKGEFITVRTYVWTGGITLCLLAAALLVSPKSWEGFGQLKADLKQNLFEIRYGKTSLPEGNLRQSGLLNESDEEMLQVQTKQEKSLYLRGYAGGAYEDGCFVELPEAAYGGKNTGILSWLEKRNFSPQLQTAFYESQTKEAPEQNLLQIQVKGASRYYVYAPVSTKEVLHGEVAGKRDAGWKGKGLFGAGKYVLTEISGLKPAELMVLDGWVSEPETEEQQEYLEAEAVYREFVYENYTVIEEGLYDFLEEMFWKEYTPEADSIYSALSHVREVLENRVSYTRTAPEIPEGEEPVEWFLKTGREGNAVMYAAATTLALRAHGIPARYVEGYYLSEGAAAAGENGTVTLTGQDAHAWTEVYFDGIGWLPVDTTPGYYYNAVMLQQMVGTPDAVRKTMALENTSFEAQQTTGLEEGLNSRYEPEPEKKGGMLIFRGVLGIVILLLSLLVALAEIIGIFQIFLRKRQYERAKPQEQVYRLKRAIYYALELRGINARLGCDTEETDEEISRQIREVREGEYKRVCEILEKSYYGGVEPEIYEKRTLWLFLRKLAFSEEGLNFGKRFRLKYGFLKIPLAMEKKSGQV